MSTVTLPKIGLGTMGGRNKKAIEAYTAAIEMGYRFLDTAHIYFNEKTVGKAIANASVPREELIVATKIFFLDMKYKKIKKRTEKALKYLQMDYLDVMYIHWPFRGYRKRKEEILKAFSELVDENKIRYLGVSNFRIDDLEKAQAIYDKNILVNQVEMHPLLHQNNLLGYMNQHEIKMVAYYPLMAGRMNKVDELLEIAKKHEVSAAQVSLAWIMSKGVIPIPKSTNIDHLKSNYEAQDLVLDADDIQKIDEIGYQKRYGDFVPFIKSGKWDD